MLLSKIKKTVLFSLSKLDSNYQELITGSSMLMLIKVIAAGLAFFFSIVLSRLFGAENIGIYYLAVTIVTVLSTLGRCGLDKCIVRFIATTNSEKNWAQMKGVYSLSLGLTFICSGIFACLLFYTSTWLSEIVFNKPGLILPLKWMAFSIIPISLFTLQAQALKGIGRVRESVTIINLLPPLGRTMLVFLLVPFFGLEGVVVAFTLSAIIIFLISHWRWQKVAPNLRKTTCQFEIKTLLLSCFPLFAVAFLTLVKSWNVTFILGRVGSGEDLGVFQIANRLAMLTNFILLSVNNFTAPKYSIYFHQKKMLKIKKIAQQATNMMVCVSTPMLLVFLIFPGTIMGIFGHDFIQGGPVLQLLAIGQFFNVATGSVNLLLIMSGNEREVWISFFWGASVSILMSLLLIETMGSVGAAFSSLGSAVVVNLISLYFVKKRLGFSPLFLASSK